jgi:hypothetical protein
MAISTHAELLTAVNSWLDVSSSDWATNQATDLVMLGEKWINAKVRSPEMEATLGATVSAAGIAAAPTGFLGLKYAYVESSGEAVPLRSVPPEQVYGRYPARTEGTTPAIVAYTAGNFICGPAGVGSVLKGVYYKRQGPLSSATYDLFTNHPDLFLFAALAEADLILGRDERVGRWMQKRDEIANLVNMEASGIISGAGMAMSPA